MKLTNIFTSIAILLTSASAQLTASYDTGYDDAQRSLTTVACSDGPNGLITRGFSTLGSLPKYPYIGGAPAVTGWNSPGCGSCWTVTYTNPQGVAKSINVLAVDVASNFNLAQPAMDDLTNGQAAFLGRVPISATSVAPSVCGL